MRTTINGKRYEVNRLTSFVQKVAPGGYLQNVSAEESAEVLRLFVQRAKANRARKVRDQAYRDCGMVKVRGSLGGTYWE
jgi:hypothetical protein